MVALGETLKQFSLNPSAESLRLSHLNLEERKSVLQQNLEAYTDEVIENNPVSILYHYWTNKEKEIFTDSSLKPIFNLRLQFDQRERGNLPIKGIYRAVDLAISNPNQIVCLYSPWGIASFDQDQDNPYSQITYLYGQLYLMYFDGVKIKALAIKISETGKKWLETIMPRLWQQTRFLETEQEIIAAFIQTPILLEAVDLFLNQTRENNFLVYEKEGRQYYLDEILTEARDRFRGKRKEAAKSYDSSLGFLEKHELTERAILNAYQSLIYDYLLTTGESQIRLSGSCGGGLTSLTDLEDFLGIENSLLDNSLIKLVSIFSSQSRLITQTEKYTFHKGKCRVCGEQTEVGPCSICKRCEKNIG
jgi:hypothetical protein